MFIVALLSPIENSHLLENEQRASFQSRAPVHASSDNIAILMGDKSWFFFRSGRHDNNASVMGSPLHGVISWHASGSVIAAGAKTTGAGSQVSYPPARVMLIAAAREMTTLPAQFECTLSETPDKEAIFDGGAVLTFRQLRLCRAPTPSPSWAFSRATASAFVCRSAPAL